MKQEELNGVLHLHKMWLENAGGVCADLSSADLSGANLRHADLRDADLRRANLRRADLHGVNLSDANLSGTDLRDADLSSADLSGADLRGADLRGADLDFSCWPLWCGSFGVKIADRIKRQLLYHVIDAIGVDFFTDEQIEEANKFHRVGGVPRLKKELKK